MSYFSLRSRIDDKMENEYIKRTDIEKNLSISSSVAIKLSRNMVANSVIEKLGKCKK